MLTLIAENDDDEVDASPEGEHTPSIMRRRNTMVGNIFKEAAKEKSKVLKLREVLQERFGDDAQSSGKSVVLHCGGIISVVHHSLV